MASCRAAAPSWPKVNPLVISVRMRACILFFDLFSDRRQMAATSYSVENEQAQLRVHTIASASVTCVPWRLCTMCRRERIDAVCDFRSRMVGAFVDRRFEDASERSDCCNG